MQVGIAHSALVSMYQPKRNQFRRTCSMLKSIRSRIVPWSITSTASSLKMVDRSSMLFTAETEGDDTQLRRPPPSKEKEGDGRDGGETAKLREIICCGTFVRQTRHSSMLNSGGWHHPVMVCLLLLSALNGRWELSSNVDNPSR